VAAHPLGGAWHIPGKTLIIGEPLPLRYALLSRRNLSVFKTLRPAWRKVSRFGRLAGAAQSSCVRSFFYPFGDPSAV